jgi:hypothetical protein
VYEATKYLQQDSVGEARQCMKQDSVRRNGSVLGKAVYEVS